MLVKRNLLILMLLFFLPAILFADGLSLKSKDTKPLELPDFSDLKLKEIKGLTVTASCKLSDGRVVDSSSVEYEGCISKSQRKFQDGQAEPKDPAVTSDDKKVNIQFGE